MNEGNERVRTVTDNEHQFQIETERSLVAIEEAVQCIAEHGGNIRIFSYVMLRAAGHLFSEIHGTADLDKALTSVSQAEIAWRQSAGSA